MKIQRIFLGFFTLLSSATGTWGQIPTARVGDVTHLQGQGRNVLVGYGLVTGLDKTGDGGKFLPTMKAVAAVVMLEAIIPDHGGREGELLDVAVTAVAAKSLAGGRLLPTPLVYHDRNVEGLFGVASRRGVVDPLCPT